MTNPPKTGAPVPSQIASPLLDQLVKDLKIDALPKDKQEEVLGQIRELAERRLLQVIMANLDEAKLAELRQKLEVGVPPEEIGAWVAAQPGLQAKVEQEMRNLYEGLLPSSQQNPTPAAPTLSSDQPPAPPTQ